MVEYHGLRKKPGPCSCDDIRWIAKISSSRQRCQRAFRTLVREDTLKHQARILGFKPKQSTHNITIIIRAVLNKSYTWKYGVVIANMDVK